MDNYIADFIPKY